MKKYLNCQVKFNNGKGALLCNDCGKIMAYGLNHEDKVHFCDECQKGFPIDNYNCRAYEKEIDYFPDQWSLIALKKDSSIVFKLLCDFRGEAGEGASWRINSGITKVIEKEDSYIFLGGSSSYKCNKSKEGMSGITYGIFHKMEKSFGNNVKCISSKEKSITNLINNHR